MFDINDVWSLHKQNKAEILNHRIQVYHSQKPGTLDRKIYRNAFRRKYDNYCTNESISNNIKIQDDI